MPEQNKPFVVTDRRKFTLDGEPRLDADPSPEKVRPPVPPPLEPSAPAFESSARLNTGEAASTPSLQVHDFPSHPAPTPEVAPGADSEDAYSPDDPNLPPPPTPEQMEQSRLAFDATAERLDLAIRAANPGMEHSPAMSFERLVQSVYMTSIMQLGGDTQAGEKPRVDLMGARQSIDMLTVVATKSAGNLTPSEQTLIDSALFELRLAFLEITQTLARSAAPKGPQPGGLGGGPGSPSFGPSIVR